MRQLVTRVTLAVGTAELFQIVVLAHRLAWQARDVIEEREAT